MDYDKIIGDPELLARYIGMCMSDANELKSNCVGLYRSLKTGMFEDLSFQGGDDASLSLMRYVVLNKGSELTTNIDYPAQICFLPKCFIDEYDERNPIVFVDRFATCSREWLVDICGFEYIDKNDGSMIVGYAPSRHEIERVKRIEVPLLKIFAIMNLIRSFAAGLTDRGGYSPRDGLIFGGANPIPSDIL